MKNIKLIALFIFILNSEFGFTQKYLLPNEEVIYSFDTQNGKKVMLAKDKNDKYIIYRYGTKSKIEFEFPEKTKESWPKFKYSFYLRGGGKMNEGMDLNYIAFTNQGFKYVIYYTYFAVEEKIDIGIKVIDVKHKKTQNIKGIYKTLKGNLVDFRDNKLIGIDKEGELYD